LDKFDDSKNRDSVRMKPLEGLLVLDFSTLLPGPMATLMLAEAGARVIKIEPRTGDAMRSYEPKWGQDSAIFAMLNRGKESLAVDLKDAQALNEILELVQKADVVVEQFRPGVMDRLGLGYSTLSQINPQLIYCSITGYGQFGPRSGDAGHDLNYAGDTGFLELSMGDISNAVLPATPIGDIGGGSFPAMINILLALEERRRSGRGLHIDIAMSENIFVFSYWALATGFVTGRWPGNGTDLVTGASPRYHIYATRDQKALIVAAIEQKFWTVFCDVIELEEALRDDGRNPLVTMTEISRIISSQDSLTWSQKLIGKDCCCSLSVSLENAVKDPHFAARGVFSAQVVNERGDSIPALPTPVFSAFRMSSEGQLNAPGLNADSFQITDSPKIAKTN